MKITVGILTISDRCSRGLREDGGGPALGKAAESLGWRVAEHAVVPDEKKEIQGILRDWCDTKKLQLILTTGGTGLGPRDVTPEATREVLDREVEGISDLMRREGMKHTPRAALSRAVAGVRGASLILNLPGSPRGAEESLRAVSGIIPHALSMMKGEGHEVVHDSAG